MVVEPNDTRTVCWFSRGAASAVATRMILSEPRAGEVVIATCDTGSEHEDSDRFEADCARWFNAPVVQALLTRSEARDHG